MHSGRGRDAHGSNALNPVARVVPSLGGMEAVPCHFGDIRADRERPLTTRDS
jgi:hypothetical protein